MSLPLSSTSPEGEIIPSPVTSKLPCGCDTTTYWRITQVPEDQKLPANVADSLHAMSVWAAQRNVNTEIIEKMNQNILHHYQLTGWRMNSINQLVHIQHNPTCPDNPVYRARRSTAKG